ncbi:hypothetical protein L1987_88825 [Smallanthus sonchifolius]|nr:hypothetical protein L1987_88825 [Smallanthus sonchifolius]
MCQPLPSFQIGDILAIGLTASTGQESCTRKRRISHRLLGLAFDPVSQSEPSRGTLRPRLESGDSLQAFSPIEDLPFRNAESSLHPTLYRALSSLFQDRSEQPASSLVDSQI